jgi:WD40 repeat protein
MQLANDDINNAPLPPTNFHPSRVAQAVNILWFSSLILSLFAALFGIFVKQWLNTYGNWSDITDPRKAVLVRDVYRRGLKLWRVPNILATLPLLLQLSLLFFVAGLVTYLWTLDVVVAGFLSVLVVIGIVVAVVAIILPVFYESCSYKSPLGLLLVHFLKSKTTSWKERDLEVLERGLPNDDEKYMHAYYEACALLEIASETNGLLSRKDLVATRVNDLKVHVDPVPFKLLRTIVSEFAYSQPSSYQLVIIQSMVHVLAAVVSAKKSPVPISVIQSFVKLVTEANFQLLESSDAIKEHISSIHVLAKSIAHYQTAFNISELAESATQLRSWLQQWLAITSGSADGNVEYKKNWPILDSLLRQRFLLRHSTDLCCAAFSPDGSKIVSGSDDSIVRVWDSNTSKVIQELKGHTDRARSVAFSPNGSRIVSGSHDHTARVWDAESGIQLRTLEGHTGWVFSVAFSPDGKRIVSGSDDHTLRVWDAESGRELHKLEGHVSRVLSVAFSPDGTRVISGSHDHTVRVWDAKSGTELLSIEGHTDWVWSVAFSPDGTRIVSGSRDHTVRAWDADSGAEIRTLRSHTNGVSSVAFSPDGTRIVSGSRDQIVRVWDADSGIELQTLTGHISPVLSVSFSQDGVYVVSSSSDETMRVWDVAPCPKLQSLEGHPGSVMSAAFSLDGSRIAFVSDDDAVRVWDASTGADLWTLNRHTGWVQSVSFSPDGTSITCQAEGAVSHTWTAPHDFPLSTNPSLPPPATPSPIFTIDFVTGWILGQKDPLSPSRRLFWVVPERRGELWSHGHRVLFSSYDYKENLSLVTLLDFEKAL